MPRKKKDPIDRQGWGGVGAGQPPAAMAITTFAPNQPSTTQVIAPVPAPPPAIVLPSSGEEALVVLQGLAEQNQRVSTARKRLEEAQALVKARKGTLETEQTRLETLLSEATEPKALPLFDAAQSEQDLRAMEEAIVAAAPEAQETSGDGDPTSESSDAVDAPNRLEAAQEAVATAETVF